MNLRRISISILSVAALGLAACGGGTTVEPGDAVTPAVPETTAPVAPEETTTGETPTQPTGEAPAEEPTTPAADRQDPVELVNLSEIAQAIDAAESHSSGTAYKIDDEDDDRTWEIDVLLPDGGGMEVEVDQASFEIVDTESDDPDFSTMPSTTLLDAITAAIAHTPGTLDDAELEREDGRLVWQVELDRTANGDDIEIYLDAETLEVVKVDD